MLFVLNTGYKTNEFDDIELYDFNKVYEKLREIKGIMKVLKPNKRDFKRIKIMNRYI